MGFQEPQKTSEHYVLEKKELDHLVNHFTWEAVHSTELFLNSCAKVVTLPVETELVVNLSMETNSMMKTSTSDILDLEFYPWLMLDQTPTDPNSSSVPLQLHGYTENTPFSVKLLEVWTLSKRWNPLQLGVMMFLQRRLSSKIAVNFKLFNQK